MTNTFMTTAMKLKCLLLGRKVMTNLESILKSRDITLPTKVYSQSYGFSSSRVQMWELDHKEGESQRCFQIVVLKNTLESPLDCEEINSECSLERLMRKLQYFGHLMQSQLFGKDPDCEKDWKQKEKRVTEDEMVGWHH